MNQANMDQEIKNVRMLISSGQLDYAQFECTRIVSNFPKNVAPLCLMSYILYNQTNYAGSTRYAKLASELIDESSDWRDVVSVSNALLMVSEEQLAVEIMSAITEITKLNYRALEVVAKQFGKLDLLEKAIDVFELAENEAMDFHSWQMYGVALMYLGRQKDAIIMFKKAIEVNSLDCISYNQLSTLNLEEERNQRISSLVKIVEEKSVDAINLSYANFSLYNEYEAAGNLEYAFRYLKDANSERRVTVSFNAEHENALYQNIIKQFANIDLLGASNSEISIAESSPIFIVGMPRTGTTLLEKILSRYTAVHSCGELRTMRMQIQKESGVMFNEPDDVGKIMDFGRLDYGRIGSEYMRNTLWRVGAAKYFTDKHPSNNVFLGLIAKALPNAKIIHITKNPMDACFSNYRQFFTFNCYTYSYDLEDLGNYYKNFRMLMDFWQSKLSNRMLNVKYEDLVMHTDREAERIRKYCGFGDEVKAEGQFITNTLSANQVRKPIHTGNINAWAKYATQLQPLRDALDKEYIDYMSEVDGVQIL